MTLNWQPLPRDNHLIKTIVECCSRIILGSECIYAKVPDKAQKDRRQPPYRYRCKACGPTQRDFQYPDDAYRQPDLLTGATQ